MVESPNPAGTVNAAAMNEETAIRVINSSDKKNPSFLSCQVLSTSAKHIRWAIGSPLQTRDQGRWSRDKQLLSHHQEGCP